MVCRCLELYSLVVYESGVVGFDEVLIEYLVHLLLMPCNLLCAQLIEIEVVIVDIYIPSLPLCKSYLHVCQPTDPPIVVAAVRHHPLLSC